MKLRVLFLGTPEFACPTLDYLIASDDIYEVVGVVTQPDRPAGRGQEIQKSRVKELAEHHLAKLSKIQKKFPILSPPTINDVTVAKQIQSLVPDIAVVVAYGQILHPAVIKLFKYGAVNVHASLLPRWRGAAPIAWSLLVEDPVTGVTLQKVAPKLDTGDVIAQTQVVLDDDWDATLLYTELSKKGADLIRRFLPDYCAGKVKSTPQDESKATHAPKINKEQGVIDWNKSAKQICAQIRALTPWPGTWSTRDGKQLKILRAKPIDYQSGDKPGAIVSVDKINFVVQCGNGTALMVLVVQPESRSRQPVAAYLQGFPFKKGDALGR